MSLLSKYMKRVKLSSEEIIATSGQIVFNLTELNIIDQSTCILLINGKKQPNSVYTIDTPQQITLVESLEEGDLLEITTIGY